MELRARDSRVSRARLALPSWWLLLVILQVSRLCWADPGVRIGSRGGVELQGGVDPYVGADLRLSFPLSPLTINPRFDYVFDEKMTLYRLSVDALYYLPVPIRRLNPYVGIGVNATSFSLKDKTPPFPDSGNPVVDDNGNRLGMNLAAGACVDLPVISPFVEVVKGIGEFDPLSLGAGLLVALDGDERWTGCGRRVR